MPQQALFWCQLKHEIAILPCPGKENDKQNRGDIINNNIGKQNKTIPACCITELQINEWEEITLELINARYQS